MTGDRVTRDAGHMNHRPPMTSDVIVTTFLAGRGMSLADVPLLSGQDNQVSPEITYEIGHTALDSRSEVIQQFTNEICQNFPVDCQDLDKTMYSQL